jgi:eukaryotic-like serine/threonine-protein kinase
MDDLGAGETARVFRARYRPRDEDRDLGLEYGTVVVLKVLRNHAELSPEKVETFQREAELLVMLDHPGIVKAITRGINAGRVWMALEYVEGESLRTIVDVLARDALRMKTQVVLSLMSELCAALAAAHELVDPRGHSLGVVHRDISPSNILVDINGSPRLIDFGNALLSARESPAEGVVGTPGYMAPEQARGEPVTPATDVYALGLIMFELLTSQRAYPVESLPDALVLQTHAHASRLDWPDHFEISGRIRTIVDHALHEDADMRPPDAGALYHLLAPMVKDLEESRRALLAVARDLVQTNAERPEPLYV